MHAIFFPTEASQTMRTGAMHGTRRKPTLAARKLGKAVHSYLAKLAKRQIATVMTVMTVMAHCEAVVMRCDAS